MKTTVRDLLSYVGLVLFVVAIVSIVCWLWSYENSVKRRCGAVCETIGAVKTRITREALCACVMPDHSVKMMSP